MSSVQGLSVFNLKKKKDELVPPNDRMYQVVKDVIELAMAMLMSPQGRYSLVDVGTAAIQVYNNPGSRTAHLYRQPLNQMRDCVDTFLTTIRSSFPFVYLNSLQGEGLTVRTSWGSRMEDYHPKEGAWMELHRTLIDNMLYAADRGNDTGKNAYRMLKFQMAITVAHELCHFFIGYLTGDKDSFTPPEMDLEGYGDEFTGESGRYWEKKLLGGTVEFYEVKNHSLGDKQAGVPYLIDNGDSRATARRVDPEYIRRFLHRDFVFPIATIHTSTTRRDLRNTSRETTLLRPGRRAVPANLVRGRSPSTALNRRLPIEAVAVESRSRWGWSR